MEKTRVSKSIESRMGALQGLPGNEPRAIGFAYAVNGEISGAETSAYRSLFMALWPDLLKSAAIEAAAEEKADTGAPWPTSAEVSAFLLAPQKAAPTENRVAPKAKMVEREAGKDLLFEFTDEDSGVSWLHRSHLRR